MSDARIVEWIRSKFQCFAQELDERARRRWAAAEARSLGRGGISAVAVATGMARNTISAGIRELDAATLNAGPRWVRSPGSGRKRLAEHDPQLQKALGALVEPSTRGDPCSPLRWTCKSTRKLAAELSRPKRPVSHMTVARLLRQAGYSWQANRKTREGESHGDHARQHEPHPCQLAWQVAKIDGYEPCVNINEAPASSPGR